MVRIMRTTDDPAADGGIQEDEHQDGDIHLVAALPTQASWWRTTTTIRTTDPPSPPRTRWWLLPPRSGAGGGRIIVWNDDVDDPDECTPDGEGGGGENDDDDHDAIAVVRRNDDLSSSASAATADGQYQNQRRNWIALLFGQSIAFMAATMNASSYTLIHHFHIEMQLFPLFVMYILLSLNFWFRQNPVLASNSHQQQPLPQPLPQDDDNNNSEQEIDRTRDSSNDHNNHNDDGVDLSDGASPTAAATTDDDDDDDDEHAQEVVGHDGYPVPFLSSSCSIRLHTPLWLYILNSLLDVFPNFLTLISFRYTSLTSTTLLGSLTVPSTMFFSKLLLSRKFHLHHYIGVLFCVVGGTLTIYMDAKDQNNHKSDQSSHSYLGDLLAVTAAVAYGLGDSVAEYFAKKKDRYEYLGMLGILGAVFTGLTFPFLEYEAIQELFSAEHGHRGVGGLFVLYIVSVLGYYMAANKFLVSSSATLLNLSMQSVNLWAIVFTNRLPPPIFAVALVLVITGVFVYEMGLRGCCCLPCKILLCRRKGRSSSQVEIVPATAESDQPAIDYQSLAIR